MSLPSIAANRALLMGVGDYQNNQFDLDGIDTDLFTMQQLAKTLGYREQDIRVLRDQEVTAENVSRAFSEFLVDGVGEDDRILVYYSGHGTQTRDYDLDEIDGRDEALSMYDMQARRNGWSGVLIDDEIERLFAAIPSRHITFIVDACHSGSANRGMELPVVETAPGTELPASNPPSSNPPLSDLLSDRPVTGDIQIKAVPFRGSGSNPQESDSTTTPASSAKAQAGNQKPAARRRATALQTMDSDTSGLVILAAAGDDQKAVTSSRGSAFTLALHEAVQRNLEQDRQPLTAQSLLSESRRILRKSVDLAIDVEPSIGGDTDLYSESMMLSTPGKWRSVQRDGLIQILGPVKVLPMSSAKARYFPGDSVSLELVLPSDGYVNILSVDSDDRISVLFPNYFHRHNGFVAGKAQLPGALPFDWTASEPIGQTLVAAVFTQKPLNLYTLALERRSENAELEAYATPTPADLLLLSNLSRDDSEWRESARAGLLTLTLCERGTACDAD